MKLINIATGEVIAEIVTNRSMSVDDVIDLFEWRVMADGCVYDEIGYFADYDNIRMEY